MDPSRQAPVRKTWSDVASQAPSPSSQRAISSKSVTRLTLKKPAPSPSPPPRSWAKKGKSTSQKVENMASEKAKHKEKQPRAMIEHYTATNGLIDTLNATYGKEILAEKYPELNLGNTSNEPRNNGLRNALEAIIHEKAIGTGADKLATTSFPRVEFDLAPEKPRPNEPNTIMPDLFDSDLGLNGYERVIYPEVGWSSSRIWISGEERERIHYEKIQTDLHRSGAEQSSFIPRTFREFLKHKAAVAAAKKRALEEDLGQLELDLERFRRVARYGNPLEQLNVPVQMSPKLVAYSERDGLTVIGGRPSMWTTYYLNLRRVHWPTRQDFKVDGDERAERGSGRLFPLPILQVPHPQYEYLACVPDPILKTVPDLPRDYRFVDQYAINSVRYDSLSIYEAELLDQPTEEISMGNVPCETRELIQSILDDDV
ncbi:hypothetical protein F5X99DRAFT_339064 [Biscogniauxia marginata]|nr:hypothetical protein F5X99DRAFT_339064 [Biscogniauxia marginata]